MKNKVKHAFDPFLKGLDLKFCDDADYAKKDTVNSRFLFYQLNQPANYQAIIPKAHDFISLALGEANQSYSASFVKYTTPDALCSLQTNRIKPLSNQFMTEQNLHESLSQSASILLTQPCWLQNIFQTFSSQSKVAIELMAVYLKLTRGGQGDPELLETCRSLFMARNIQIPMLSSYAYSRQAEILHAMFDFACHQLALSRFPRVLFPELLGFTVAYCKLPTLIEICFPAHQLQLPATFFELRQQRTKGQLPALLDCISSYLNLFPDQKKYCWDRVQNGYWLYYSQMLHCRDALDQLLSHSLSPAQAVAKLFQQKAPAAIGHHKKIQIQGKSLDSWFAGMPENSQTFLHALRQSNYVDNETPESSYLLKLFTSKGPMFGVMNEAELTIIKDWLKADKNTSISESEHAQQTAYSTEEFQPTKQRKNLSNRELYYYLVNADLYPDVLPEAKAKVVNLLNACRLFNPLPFKNYSHQQFDTYIDVNYQREVKAYQPLQGKPKVSKAAYIWGLEQVAPMILIDGCWLQNSLAIQYSNPVIAEILFSIYCDELGNGKLEQSHPVIFQQLLDSLSIQVPPVYSERFAKHRGFISSAFDLPVYMMGLSQFSVEFLPELLGLNMAIELSGLGNSYMRLVDEWSYWGIDPAIASLHISIDNVASGHTFLAKKAIQLYMDDVIQRSGDSQALDQHWRRIYTGYNSLRFVGWRFKLSLPVMFLINRMCHKYKLGNIE